MDTGITLNPQRRAALVASGAWQDQTLLDYLDTTVARTPDRPAIIGYRVGDDTRTELSYRDLDQTVTRMAAGAWQPWASSRATWSPASCQTGGRPPPCTWPACASAPS